jgi:hypothetical protein
MTTAAFSPLQKQGDVSKDSTAPTAVFPQGSSSPPTATTSHEQGTKTFPTATTTCTHCTPGPSPYAYKRKVQGSRTRRLAARENGPTHKALALSLSPTRTLVTPYCKRIHPPWAQDNTKAAGSPYCSPPFVSRLAPTHLGWDTQRQFTRRSRDPRGRNVDSWRAR